MEEIYKINKCKYNVNGSCKLEILTPCGLVPNKDCYYKQLLRKEKELSKCQQALQEIKEICLNETHNLTDSCVNGGRYFEILEKISEVEE